MGKNVLHGKIISGTKYFAGLFGKIKFIQNDQGYQTVKKERAYPWQ